MKNPIQPLVKDQHGTLRFKENEIVRHLLDWATAKGYGLNELAQVDFSRDDWCQLAQLIGYSLDGYADLSYVSEDDYGYARLMAKAGMTEKDAKIEYLEGELNHLRRALRKPMARLYGVHPDDLKG